MSKQRMFEARKGTRVKKCENLVTNESWMYRTMKEVKEALLTTQRMPAVLGQSVVDEHSEIGALYASCAPYKPSEPQKGTPATPGQKFR